MIVDLVGWLHFYFIRSIVGLGINRAVSLTIDGAVFMGKKVAVSFSKLLL